MTSDQLLPRPSGVDQGFRGVEEPGQRFPQLRRLEPGCEVAFDVGDRALQHVEPVAQRVELRTRQHQLVFAEPELVGPVPSFVVTLAAALAAVLAAPPPPPRRWARPRRPPAPAGPAA